MQLTPAELEALRACMDVAQEGPEEIVVVANLAMRKLLNPGAADLADRFYNDTVVSGYFWDVDDQHPAPSDDFIKGMMYHWFISRSDYDTTTDGLREVEAMFPFFVEMIE